MRNEKSFTRKYATIALKRYMSRSSVTVHTKPAKHYIQRRGNGKGAL